MTRDPDHVITALAAAQSWAFSRAQALDAGFTDPTIARRLRSGRWRRIHPGVYAIAGAPPGLWQGLWAARLAVGRDAIVSHESAAALLGVPGFALARPVLTDEHGYHHHISGAVVHQISDVLPSHRMVHRLSGLPMTTPSRTVVDLAGVAHPSRLRFVIDELVAARLVDDLDVATCLGEVARPGKRGVRALGAVLDGRTAAGRRPPKSWLEREVLRIAEQAGLPAPSLQHRHPGRQDVDGCVDFAWPVPKLIVEADGRRWHSRIADVRRDRERDNQAARAGWQTLRFLFETIKADPIDVGRTMVEVYDLRLRELAA